MAQHTSSTLLKPRVVQGRGPRRSQLASIAITAFTALLAAGFLWPFLAILGQSFNRIDVRANALSPIPTAFTLQYYEAIVTRYHFERYFLNTILVVASSTILSTLACALAGYAFAKLEFRGRNTLFVLVLAIMLLPTTTMLVPQFVVMRQLGLVNNYWGLILPSMGGSAFGIFLMRQFMLQIPTELLEAGRIDGCSEFSLFPRLVLPNVSGPIAVLAILSLQGGWNSVLWPQILISDDAKQLLMPAIIRLNQSSTGDVFAYPTTICAALVSAIIPVALYLYSQRYFVDALSGTLKG
jgi:multiple sugar transport system permease protein